MDEASYGGRIQKPDPEPADGDGRSLAAEENHSGHLAGAQPAVIIRKAKTFFLCVSTFCILAF